jgi:peptide-methionine (S)-S-oxide reductase
LSFGASGAGDDGQNARSYISVRSNRIRTMERATFGAGCFWGGESFFRAVPGVADAVVGDAAGAVGHAEVAQVTYDPTNVNYDRLLDVFCANHDPTTVNRPGPDHGSLSCSVLFAGRFKRPIVTAVEPFRFFYRAEDYHQRYFEKNGLPSCHVNIPEP